MAFATFPNKFKILPPGPQSAVFYSALSASAIATEKASIESSFPGVGYNYEVQGGMFKVTLTGPLVPFANAIRFLNPRDTSYIGDRPGKFGLPINSYDGVFFTR